MAGLIKKDVIRKIALLGVGIAALSREKAKRLAEELARTERINEKEGKALVNSILRQAEVSGRALEKKVKGELQRTIKSSRLVSAREVESLERKVSALEKRLKALSKKKKR